ncbi:unnamed protein product [Vitrella brassicaformis CCMP3155]|uniref:Uncharacterized protein n=1 Tax=Vitrella brassicaformis (strain CCMP3155) TaxID=1169540 RepID=A0A0G4FAF1_VITBC|nr:unnamed protein product [Vitrella brassicaformis CCMP3155]|eukprot:CEM09875.1 unnamed protein product [Vitrella brassicaformis CCMP3155]
MADEEDDRPIYAGLPPPAPQSEDSDVYPAGALRTLGQARAAVVTKLRFVIDRWCPDEVRIPIWAHVQKLCRPGMEVTDFLGGMYLMILGGVVPRLPDDAPYKWSPDKHAFVEKGVTERRLPPAMKASKVLPAQEWHTHALGKLEPLFEEACGKMAPDARDRCMAGWRLMAARLRVPGLPPLDDLLKDACESEVELLWPRTPEECTRARGRVGVLCAVGALVLATGHLPDGLDKDKLSPLVHDFLWGLVSLRESSGGKDADGDVRMTAEASSAVVEPDEDAPLTTRLNRTLSALTVMAQLAEVDQVHNRSVVYRLENTIALSATSRRDLLRNIKTGMAMFTGATMRQLGLLTESSAVFMSTQIAIKTEDGSGRISVPACGMEVADSMATGDVGLICWAKPDDWGGGRVLTVATVEQEGVARQVYKMDIFHAVLATKGYPSDAVMKLFIRLSTITHVAVGDIIWPRTRALSSFQVFHFGDGDVHGLEIALAIAARLERHKVDVHWCAVTCLQVEMWAAQAKLEPKALSKSDEKKVDAMLRGPTEGRKSAEYAAYEEKHETKLFKKCVKGQLETILKTQQQMKLDMVFDKVDEGVLKKAFQQLKDKRLAEDAAENNERM